MGSIDSSRFTAHYGMGLGNFFRSSAEEEARRMGKTFDEIRSWQPPGKLPRKGTEAAKREKERV